MNFTVNHNKSNYIVSRWLFIVIALLLFFQTYKTNAQVTPIITTGALTGSISSCIGTPSSSPNILRFTVSGSGLTGSITATAPAGFEVSPLSGGGYSNSIIFSQSAGIVNSTIVYVRSAASAAVGNLTGNVVLTSTGATPQNVAVAGIVNALPTINAISNQAITTGSATAAVNFAGTANVFNWVNDNPGIGLPASGTGNIPSFTSINNGSGPVTANITVIPQPLGFAYISNITSNTVSVINLASNAVVATIPVGSSPIGVSVSPNGARAYITNYGAGTITVIDAITNTVLANIRVGSYPYGLVVSHDGSKVYAANFSDGTLSVINTATNTVTATIPAGIHALCIVESPDGNRLYVTDNWNHVVSVINTSTNSVIRTIDIGVEPWGLAITPDGSRVYVGSSNSKVVTVINTVNYAVSTILVGSDPKGISVTPDGKFVYSVNSGANTVSVINTATNAVAATIPVSLEPLGVSFNQDGSRAYISSTGANNVAVINTATNTVITTVDVGLQPNTIGNFVTTGTGCTGTPVTFTITVNLNITPTITVTGSLAALNTVYGTPSTSAVFMVSGTNLTAGILVAPPAGFEVSTDNITFSNAITVGGAGTVAPIQVFIRLKSTTAAGNYSGNVVLSSAGATNANVTGANGTVARAQLNITVTNKAKIYGISLLSAAGSTAFTPSGLKNSESIGSVTITYGPGDLATAPVGTYTGSVVASVATGGTFTAGNYVITYHAGDIIVTAATLTIKADNQNRPFATINPVLTVTYSGFVNNEGPAQLASQPMVNTTASSTSLPGNYPITVSSAASTNYTFNYIPGVFTVTPMVQQIDVPNTFTPNGDGINDTWDINYLNSSYPHCMVEVLNRYGEKVYFSNGYPIAWDGRYKNANLPVGTYYYLINIGSGNKPISGYVTIIR